MVVTVVVVVLVAAAALGFWAQHRWLSRRPHDDPAARTEGLSVSDLVVPARTLAALLLAFVVVAVYQSFDDAEKQAASEAGSVLSMGETTLLLTPTARADVLGRLECYARSVVGPDWRSQTDGGLSPDTDRAADGVTAALGRAVADPRNVTAVSSMLSDNRDRIQTRILRVSDARPSVPAELWALLLVALALMVGGLAALGHAGVRSRVQLVIAASTTVVFGLTLLLVHDLDHPYGGPARIDPTAMVTVQGRLADLPGRLVPPCDGEGRSG